MKNKQTAVEWLQIKMATSSTQEMVENINLWFQQAKEMEREQKKSADEDIVNAFNYAHHMRYGSESQINSGEEYLREKYYKETKNK